MSCPFSTSKVYNEVNCFGREGAVACPFVDECNNTMIWDSIKEYIRKGIEVYELAEMQKKGKNNANTKRSTIVIK